MQIEHVVKDTLMQIHFEFESLLLYREGSGENVMNFQHGFQLFIQNCNKSQYNSVKLISTVYWAHMSVETTIVMRYVHNTHAHTHTLTHMHTHIHDRMAGFNRGTTSYRSTRRASST